MIISETKIFNIFPGFSETKLVAKILSPYCNRYTYKYIPRRDLWIDRLYYDISNCTEKKFFTIDTQNINYLRPPKLRTDAKNGKEQVCYFNLNKKDKIYNKFLAVKKKHPPLI